MTPAEGSTPAGGANTGQTPAPGVVAGLDGVELLGTAPEIRETVTLGPGWLNGSGLLAVAAVLALGVGLLLAVGAGDSETSELPGTEGPQTTPTYEPASDRSRDGGRTTTTRRRPTTTAPTTEVLGDGSPLLGRPSGWSLIFGDEGPMHQLDLDSALLRRVGLSGAPVAVIGDWLVMERSGSTFAVPLDDPVNGERADLSGQGGPVAVVRPGPEPGQAWLTGWLSFDGFAVRLVDLDDPGTVLAEIPMSQPIWTDFGPAAVDGSILSSPTGGVFVPAGDGYTRVSDAWPVAIADDVILTRTCSQPDRCQHTWLERGTWRPIDRPLPDELPSVSFSGPWLSPDGRMLAYRLADDPAVVLFDVTRNTSVRSVPELYDGAPVVSPDGRYVGVVEQSQIFVYDVDEGTSHVISAGPGGGGRMVFVANGS